MTIRYQKPSQRILTHVKNVREIQMPLVKGRKAKTSKGFSANVKAEMRAGKPQNQAVSIAYSAASGKKKLKKKKFWKD